MKTFLHFLLLFFTVFIHAQVPVVEMVPDYPTQQEYNVSEENYPYERIIDFHSDIKIAKNAEVTVKETIEVYANGNEIKRGLFRALPTMRNTKEGKIKIRYNIVSIKKDGVKESYHTELVNGVLNIYIGNKNIILNPGNYTYEIIYRTEDQISHFEGFDEFYWNVNGTDWSFDTEKISTTVTLPDGAIISQSSCYTGVSGSINRECRIEKQSPTSMSISANDLKEKQNLTIAIGFKAGILKEPSAFMKNLKRNWPSVFLLFAAFYLIYFYVTNWRKYGKDPEKPVVIPQFNAPGNLSPASIGYINDGKFSVTHVTANLVDLAVKGFIDIDEDKDHPAESTFAKIYNIKKIDKKTENLQDDENLLLKNIFGKQKLVVFNGTYSSKIKNAIDKFENFITEKNAIFKEQFVNKDIFFNAAKIVFGLFFTCLILGCIFTSEYNALVTIIPLFLFCGLFFTMTFGFFKAKLSWGYIGLYLFASLFTFPLFKLAVYNLDDINRFQSDCFKFLLFGMFTLPVFRFLINKPTEEKLKMDSEIEGFKMYLGTAEEKLLQFHNPPEMTTDLYEKFLPYAIVFNVEGIWGKRFRNKIKETLDARSPEISQSHLKYGFAESITTAVIASTFEPPQNSSFSSSSSGSSSSSSSSSRSSSSSSYSGGSSSSGSSGGGSSGGGGGGGGGGGW